MAVLSIVKVGLSPATKMAVVADVSVKITDPHDPNKCMGDFSIKFAPDVGELESLKFAMDGVKTAYVVGKLLAAGIDNIAVHQVKLVDVTSTFCGLQETGDCND